MSMILPSLMGLNFVASKLLLDDFSSAKEAWSIYKLLSAYTGSCIRVRRSGDNAEQDFGFINNILDFAAVLAWVIAGGGTQNGMIISVYGQITGNAYTQSTALSQPLIVASGVLVDSSNALFQGIADDGSSIQIIASNAGLDLSNTGTIVTKARMQPAGYSGTLFGHVFSSTNNFAIVNAGGNLRTFFQDSSNVIYNSVQKGWSGLTYLAHTIRYATGSGGIVKYSKDLDHYYSAIIGNTTVTVNQRLIFQSSFNTDDFFQTQIVFNESLSDSDLEIILAGI